MGSTPTLSALIIKNVTQLGNPILRTRTKEVPDPKEISAIKTVKDLIDSMRHHQLVGMAAPQIGIGLRIFVSEIRATKFRKAQSVKNTDPLRTYINPKITWLSKKKVAGWEGCGSVVNSGLFAMVTRPESVVVEAQDENGKHFKLKAKNLLARVIQHEYDHLNGRVFTDIADRKTFIGSEEYRKSFLNKP